MTTVATVPVTVTPEAAARIAELGLRPQVDRIIEYALGHLPRVTRITVELHDRYDLGKEPVLVIEAFGQGSPESDYQAERAMDRWVVSEFPPEVLMHLVTFYRPWD